ncbi:MAG: LPD38 domain-containing protein [Pseudomonadota bacterium]
MDASNPFAKYAPTAPVRSVTPAARPSETDNRPTPVNPFMKYAPADAGPFDGESFGALATRRGQQVVAGAAEVVASVPEAMAIRRAASERGLEQRFRAETSQQEAEAKRFQEILDGGVSPIDGSPLSDAERAQFERRLQGALRGAQTGTRLNQFRDENPVVPAQERELFKRGDEVREAASQTFGAPDPRDRGFWSQVAGGLGNVAAMGAGAVAAGPAGIAVGAGLGAAMNSSQVYREAIEAGATEEDAELASQYASIVGTAEVIPLTRALKLLPPRVRSQIGGRVMRTLTNAAQSGGEEAVQEAAAGIANNMIARGIYDPDRGWTEGVGEQGAVGFVVGAMLGTAGSAIRRPNVEAQVTRPPQPGSEEESPISSAPQAAPAPVAAPDERVVPDQVSGLPPEPGAPLQARPVAAPIPQEVIDDGATLLGAGYDPADVLAMNVEERAAEAASLRDTQGVQAIARDVAERRLMAARAASEPDAPMLTQGDLASALPNDRLEAGRREVERKIAVAQGREAPRKPVEGASAPSLPAVNLTTEPGTALPEGAFGFDPTPPPRPVEQVDSLADVDVDPQGLAFPGMGDVAAPVQPQPQASRILDVPPEQRIQPDLLGGPSRTEAELANAERAPREARQFLVQVGGIEPGEVAQLSDAEALEGAAEIRRDIERETSVAQVPPNPPTPTSATPQGELDTRSTGIVDTAAREVQPAVTAVEARPARQEPDAPPAAETAQQGAGSPAIEEFTDKSLIVRGLSQEDGRSLFDGMKGKPLWNKKQQGWVFPRRRRGEMQALLGAPSPSAVQSAPRKLLLRQKLLQRAASDRGFPAPSTNAELKEWNKLQREGMLKSLGAPQNSTAVRYGLTAAGRAELEGRTAAAPNPELVSNNSEAPTRAPEESDTRSAEGQTSPPLQAREEATTAPAEPDAAAKKEVGVAGDEPRPGRAAPLYVKRSVANPQPILDWAAAQGFRSTLLPSDLHVTVAFSRDPVDPADAPADSERLQIDVDGSRPKKLGDKGAVVLPLGNQSRLESGWQRYRNAGASWDFPSYQPHVTITYKGQGLDLDAMQPFNGSIELGPEDHRALDPDASSDVEEVAVDRPAPRARKRPFTSSVRGSGGIDPSGPAAAELRSRGVTNRSAPGLFKRGGRKSLDNLPANDFGDLAAQEIGTDDTGQYLSPDGVYDAIAREVTAGQPVVTDSDALADRADDVPASSSGPGPSLTPSALPPDANEFLREATVDDLASAPETAALRQRLDDLGLSNVELATNADMAGQRAVAMFKMQRQGGRPVKAEILVSAAMGQDPMQSVNHEALHALYHTGVISEADWAVLGRRAEREWISRHRIKQRYADADRDRQIEEAIAEEFSAFSAGDRTPIGPVKRAYDAVRGFLEAAGNWMRGLGFRTADDVMAWLDRGGGVSSSDAAERRSNDRRSRAEDADTLRDRVSAARSQGDPQPSRRTVQEPKGDDTVERERRAPPAQEPFQTYENWTADAVATAFMPWNWGALASAENWANVRTVMERSFWASRADLLRQQKAIENAKGEPLPEAQNTFAVAKLYIGKTADRMEKLYDETVKPITQALRDAKIDRQEIEWYLIAKNVRERNAMIAGLYAQSDPESDFARAAENDNVKGGSGYSNKWADDQIAKAEASPKAVDLKRVAGMVRKMLDDSLRSQVKSGLISDADAKAMRQAMPNYIPLRGFADDTGEGQGRAGGRGFDIRGKESQRAMGRTTESDSPLSYALAQAANTIIRSEKNAVGRSLLLLVQNNPNEKLWEIDRATPSKSVRKVPQFDSRTGDFVLDPTTGMPKMVEQAFATSRPDNRFDPNVMIVKQGGREIRITIHHDGIAQGLKQLHPEGMSWFVRTMGGLTRLVAALNTRWNPDFIIPNLTRDIQASVLQIGDVQSKEVASKMRRSLVRNMAPAVKGMAQHFSGVGSGKWKDLAAEMIEAGGKVSYIDYNDVQGIKALIDRESDPQSVMRRFLKVKRGAGAAIEFFADSTENGIRLAAYVAAKDAGLSKQQAAIIARDITTDFNQRGTLSPSMNAWFLFFNAAVGGTVRTGRALTQSRFTQKAAGGLVLLGLLEALGGDEEYEKVPDWQRERSIIVPSYLTGMEPGENVKIPLPWVFNVFKVIGSETGRALRYGEPAEEAAARIISSMFAALSPIQSLNPSAFAPVVEAYGFNENWLGQRIAPDYPFSKGPDSERYFPSVNRYIRDLTTWVNEATGGNQGRSGSVLGFDTSFNPEYIEHILEAYGGGSLRFINRMMKLGEDAAEGRLIEWEKAPLTRQFYSRTFGEAPARRLYYRLEEEASQVAYEMETNRKAGRDDLVKAARERDPALLKMIPVFKATEKRIRKLKAKERRQREALKFGRITEDVFETRTEEIRVQMHELRMQALERVGKLSRE